VRKEGAAAGGSERAFGKSCELIGKIQTGLHDFTISKTLYCTISTLQSWISMLVACP
jgi:hypothetical protein